MIIDLLEKTPDSLLGLLAASTAWFAFNYVTLAPRAAAVDMHKDVVPACIISLERAENAAPINRVPQLSLPGYENDPLGKLLGGVIDMATRGQRLTQAQRYARCICAAKTSSTTFDYAIHTSSFRLIEPDSVNGLRSKSLKIVQSQSCGALPWLNSGR